MREPKTSFRYQLTLRFITETERWLDEFERLLAGYGEDVKADNYELYRLAHTIKGSALTVGLGTTAEVAGLAERMLLEPAFGEEAPLAPDLRRTLSTWTVLMRRLVHNYSEGLLSEVELLGEARRVFSVPPGGRGEI